MQALVLIRHGESEGNSQGILTGKLDVPLTVTGAEQARMAGRIVSRRGISFDAAYSSKLQRAQQTMNLVVGELPEYPGKIVEHNALNERDFGDYTGATKSLLQAKLGEAEYNRVVKGWNVPAPHGESLQDVQLRVAPFFQKFIISDLATGKNILVISHHQTLRALAKYIENIADSDIRSLSIENAVPMVYLYDPGTGVLTRDSSVEV